MKKNYSSGQAFTEYGLILALVAVCVVVVLAVTSPAVGRAFRGATDSAVNSDVKNLGYRLTQTVFAGSFTPASTSTPTETPIPPTSTNTPVIPTSTYTPIPPTATFTRTHTPTNSPVPGTATHTNTPVPPTATRTHTPIPPTATFTMTPTPSGSWVFCANENSTCTFPGTTQVRYGADGYFKYLTLTTTTPCTNTVFTDPIVGTYKYCHYWVPNGGPVSTSTFTPGPATNTPLPSGWTTCANEDGFCSFIGTMTVRYGNYQPNGNWKGVTYPSKVTNGIWCTNAVFGDPWNGKEKICQFMP